MSGFVADSLVLGARAVTRSARNPGSIMGAVLFPLLFFALFLVVMERVMESRGFDYRQLLPSTIVAQAMLFSGMSSAYYIADDCRAGVLGRFRSLPIHRAAPLVGRSLADLARATVSIVVVVIVSLALGMRFERGLLSVVGFVVVALLFALAVSLGMGLIGYAASSPEAATSIASVPYLPLLMLSSGFAPVDDFPSWLQPVVRWQPVTAVIDAMRALAGDGALAEPVVRTVAWSLGLALVFGILATRAMRAAT